MSIVLTSELPMNYFLHYLKKMYRQSTDLIQYNMSKTDIPDHTVQAGSTADKNMPLIILYCPYLIKQHSWVNLQA